MTTRAELRARGDLTRTEADDVFELATRLQVADRALDPARRPLGEGRALDERLEVAEHFIDEARARLARREVAAAARPFQQDPPARWPLAVIALVVAGLVGLIGTILVGRERVDQAQRAARVAERALEAELIQQVDRASAVTAFAGPAGGAVEPLRLAAIAAPDVPEQLVSVGALGREMQRVLQDMPSPETQARARLHADLGQQVRDSRTRINASARGWRDANSAWALASDHGPGQLAILLEMAEAPPGPIRSLPRP